MTKKVTPVVQENTEPATGIVTDQAVDLSNVQKEISEYPQEPDPISGSLDVLPIEGSDDTEDEALNRIIEVFASHDVDEIYMTTDGTAFIHPQYARLHSENLENNTVITIKRQEV